MKKNKKRKAQVSKVLHQVKEPFSLLQTLKEEGLSSAMMFLNVASSMASGASKNLKLEAIGPQIKDFVSSLGFVTKADIERLESRIEELEQKLSEREYAALATQDEE